MIVHSITNDLRFVGNASKRLVKKPESPEYVKKETRETDLIKCVTFLFELQYLICICQKLCCPHCRQ